MASQSLNLGFIGLGIMGAPMCGHLIAGGHKMFVTTRSKVPEAIAQTGATVCKSAHEVASRADIIFLMVPDTPDVERVLFGDQGVASGLTKSKVVVDMSSISPIATKEYAKKINALGCEYLDAPVSGGEVGAKNAALTIMVGGSDTTLSVEMAMVRPQRLPTRSSLHLILRPFPRPCCSQPKRVQIPPKSAKP
jgi:2-hydroxy-3-oxopropionate reductase